MATSSEGVAESRSGPRKRAVRWNEPSLLRTTPVATSAAQGRKSERLWALRRYSARLIIAPPSRDQMLRIAQVPADDLDEGGVALGRPDRGKVADQPDRGAGEPEAEAQSDRRGERAVHDGDCARRAGEQD